MNADPPCRPQDIPADRHGDRLRLLAYPLFFASGMAGLVYEIVWSRLLYYIFGTGIYAVTAVLAAFMAGLALGSWAFGRIADRLETPIRLYGVLEVLIAGAGLALPPILGRLDVVNAWSYANFGQNFAAFTAARFAVTFGLLLVPTTLMGATLPVLSRAMVRHGRHLGARVGELYAMNTFGALAGTFLAGFYLIERFGVYQTEAIAASLNGIAAVGAFSISWKLERRNKVGIEPKETAIVPESAPAPMPVHDGNRESRALEPIAELERKQIIVVMTAVFLTGVVSLGAQVLWFRSLTFASKYMNSTTYAFSAMLTVFLAGLALGSALIGPVVDRLRNPMRIFGILIAFLALAMAASVTALHTGVHAVSFGEAYDPQSGTLNWKLATANVFLKTVYVLGLPTLLMGMAFPTAVRAVATARHVGSRVGQLYALNTAGAIVGTLITCFMIVPLFGLTKGLLLLAGVDLVIGLCLIGSAPKPIQGLLTYSPLCMALFAVFSWRTPYDRGLQPLRDFEELVFYEEGPLATVAVVNDKYGHNMIKIDGIGVAGTEPILQTDQKSLAHVPMLVVKDPRSALTVGFGSGGASYSYLLHDRLEKVHCVEISPTVLKAAPYLEAANHGVLEKNDPRYRVILDDVRAYLQYTDEFYDIIATDCTDLSYKSSANLYDFEYFQACRNRLKPGGAVVVWMPLDGLSQELFKMTLRTVHRVFPEMAIFYMNNEPTHYVLLIGWRDKMVLDYRLFAERLAEEDIRSDLAEIHLADPVKLLSTFVTAGEILDEYLAGDAINTENRPILEFKAPKFDYGGNPKLDNLKSLMGIRQPVDRWLDMKTMPPEERERLARYEAAFPLVLEGHAASLRFDFETATLRYLEARRLTPDDSSLDNLLEFERLVYASEIGSLFETLALGRARMLQGRLEEAVTYFERVGTIVGMRGGIRTNFERESIIKAEQWLEEIEQMKKNAAPVAVGNAKS